MSNPRREVWLASAVVAAVAALLSWVGAGPKLAPYTSLGIALLFLFSALRLAGSEAERFGLALGGLLAPLRSDPESSSRGILKSLFKAIPSGLRESLAALLIALCIFPLFTVLYYYWYAPTQDFSLEFARDLSMRLLSQVLLVALPEEAFFRGYVQTRLSDAESKRIRIFGVRIAPLALLPQSALFALMDLITNPHPARRAGFFPGLLFGWTRCWRGGIGAAIVLHALSNLYSDTLARSWLY